MSKHLQGTLSLPGDKSISHRALMMLGLSRGQAVISNLSSGQDVMSTLACMRTLGCQIESLGDNRWKVTGREQFIVPSEPLDCGNSGTTIRLMSGILAGAGIAATLTGDSSLCKRPMKRVIDPLSQMGVTINATGDALTAPLKLEPAAHGISGVHYTLPMASAQVKSAILLAGLFADPQTQVVVEEPLPSRDHTERMLTALGARVETVGHTITLHGRKSDMVAQDIVVPGDISSAAFWLVGAAILPGSVLRIQQVSLNPGRTGLLSVLKRMGLHINIENQGISCGEPYGDLVFESQPLKGDIVIEPELVPALIDEIPILTILGLFTAGRFTLRGAEELRFKESDRLGSLIHLLETFGVAVEAYPDGMSFTGNPVWEVPSVSKPLETHHDHRLVMALEILNLRSKTALPIEGTSWVGISYPGFYDTMQHLLMARSRG